MGDLEERVVSAATGPPDRAPEERDPRYDDPEDAKKLLKDFVEQDVRAFVAFLVLNFSWLASEEAQEFEPLVQAAWTELAPAFQEAGEAIMGVTVNDLRAHGLIGDQLRLKLLTLTPDIGRFLGRLDPRRLFRGHIDAEAQATRKWATRLSDGIDNVLASIAILAAPVGAISEVKHHIKWLISERAGAQPGLVTRPAGENPSTLQQT